MKLPVTILAVNLNMSALSWAGKYSDVSMAFHSTKTVNCFSRRNAKPNSLYNLHDAFSNTIDPRHSRAYGRSNKFWQLDSQQNDFNESEQSDSFLQSLSLTSNASSHQQLTLEISRRKIIFNLLTLTAITQLPTSAQSSSQIDATGQLYSPKNEMLSQGGSAAARGIKLPKKERSSRGKNNNLLSTGGLIQDVYETRFVAYLTRFLLTFDPASSAWWKVCEPFQGQIVILFDFKPNCILNM